MTIAIIKAEQVEAIAALAERLDARGLPQESGALRQVVSQLKEGPREVPASAAAAFLAVSPQTVRNWIRAGLLPARRDATGHFYVGVDALGTWPGLAPSPSSD
jgi:hypothetical protein